MGWAERINPNTLPEMRRRLTLEHGMRAMLALFPDRTTYEQWLGSRAVTDEQRAHLEQFLPARLQQEGTV